MVINNISSVDISSSKNLKAVEVDDGRDLNLNDPSTASDAQSVRGIQVTISEEGKNLSNEEDPNKELMYEKMLNGNEGKPTTDTPRPTGEGSYSSLNSDCE